MLHGSTLLVRKSDQISPAKNAPSRSRGLHLVAVQNAVHRPEPAIEITYAGYKQRPVSKVAAKTLGAATCDEIAELNCKGLPTRLHQGYSAEIDKICACPKDMDLSRLRTGRWVLRPNVTWRWDTLVHASV